MTNLDGVVGDSRKRIEEHLEINVVVPAPEADRCGCGHSRWKHFVQRADLTTLACICGCPAFTVKWPR